MEILLWLVPALVATAVAACWVGWVGRERAGEADREVLAERLARALQKDVPVRYAARTPERDRSTGIAVRPSRDPRGTGSAGRRAS
ncbi:hypothetical protein [Nocardioides ochotonae]|uniref:hypothetical protein n=1 Tax=Nocardioides ochotonae TaxID=2685869 RepID=UPI00140B1151|nr:hypothetical protein [Nocardioides ochotonae]